LGGYGLALAALALVVFGAIECPPKFQTFIAYTYFSAAQVALSGIRLG